MKIGVLTSGSLGLVNLEKINSNYNVVFVLTDSNSHTILKFCDEHRIVCYKGNPRNGLGYDFIKDIEVDIIVSINYLFLIENDIIQHSKKVTFNIHGSLLPKYRGRSPHVWAIINNENKTGITAHVIDENCDTGDIISQIIIPIGFNDTGNDILNKFKLKYYNLLEEVFEKVISNQLVLVKQENSLATYFGIRKPENGKIDWNWQKERIYNWIRAQASPYPGAFTYYKGNKFTIDNVAFSSFKFDYNIPNGTILNENPIIVKTPNGALEILLYREKYQLIKEEILK